MPDQLIVASIQTVGTAPTKLRQAATKNKKLETNKEKEIGALVQVVVTIFADPIVKTKTSPYKIREKVQALVISNLSLKSRHARSDSCTRRLKLKRKSIKYEV